ncbi:hypothetical protein [Pedobacter gandavensis]|uniref:hypothetical protein n=1 Tax=Pedobacter gandavensis TaxID=2679963 RepID=UPI00292FCFAA|nr:hypothetical protein [Pedobacter gandavensis]
MKKISLKNLNLKEVEQLSREQLKDVLGGWTGSTTTGPTQSGTTAEYCNCLSHDDCPSNMLCIVQPCQGSQGGGRCEVY